MLRRIHIRNYKSLEDLEVTLDPLVVVFGPNGAGKSNFLDALQLLSRVATCRTLKDAFEPPYRGTPLESFTFGAGGIQGLLEQEAVSFSIEVDVELSNSVVEKVNRQIREMRRARPAETGNGAAGATKKLSFVKERRLRYRIEVEILPRSGILRVADEYLTALSSTGEPTGKRKPFMERVKDRLHLHGRAGASHVSRAEPRPQYSLASSVSPSLPTPGGYAAGTGKLVPFSTLSRGSGCEPPTR